MNCTEYAVLLEKFLDGSLTAAEEAQMQQHEASCSDCAALRRTLDNLQDDLTNLADAPAMPASFHQAWMQKVEEEPMENRECTPRSARPWIRMLSTAAALVFVLGGTLLTRDTLSPRSLESAASTASLYSNAYTEDAAFDGVESASGIMLTSSSTEAETNTASRSVRSVSSSIAEQEQKIIRTASLIIGTRSYDASLSALRQLSENAGGWISYSSENITSSGLRRAYLTLRLPTEQLDSYLSSTDTLGRIISKDESATDVTESYYDTQSRLDTQLALMERLQAMMTDTADLSDLLELESKIADTQYTIDSLRSSLNSTDSQVNYATLDITLREETSATALTDSEKSLWQRLTGALETGWNAFRDFLEDALVFLTAALPFIGIVMVVWFAVHLLRKRHH